MYIKELEIYNYGPFRGCHKVTFSDTSEVIFIKGEYDENPNKSNKSGKSSFVESIQYLLFGTVRDRLKETDLIYKNAEEMYVKGIVSLNGTDVTIKRGRTSDNKPTLEIEGIKGSKAAKEKEFIDLLGFTASDFENTYFFSQDDFHGFMKAPPREKKNLLQTWFKLDRWKVYEAKAKELHSESQIQLGKLESNIVIYKSQLDSIVINDEVVISDEIAKRTDSWNESKNRLVQLNLELKSIDNSNELSNKLGKLVLELGNFSNQLNQAKSQESQILNKIKTANENILKVKELSTKLININELQELINQKRDNLTKISSEMAVCQNDKNAKEILQKSLCSFTGVCPIDSKPCDKGTRIPDYNNEITNELGNLKELLTSLQENYYNIKKELSEYEVKVGQNRQIESQISNLEKNSDVNEYNKGLEFIKGSMGNLESQIQKINIDKTSVELEIQNMDNSKKNELLGKINDENKLQSMLLGRLNELSSELGKIKQNKELKSKLESSVSETNTKISESKKRVYRYAYLGSIFGKDGIPSILVENSLSKIEEIANLLLETMAPGVSIQFSTQKEVGTKESHCSVCGNIYAKNENKCSNCDYGYKKSTKMRDEIDIRIDEGYGDLSFSQTSGGGKVIISLAIRSALSKMLSSNSRKCETLVLDEVFASLDDVNRDLISKVVFNTLKDIIGFRKIFVISHCSLNNYNYKTIKIRRKSNFSEICT